MSDQQAKQALEDSAQIKRRLEEHLALTQRYIDSGKQADRVILDSDMQTMPDFIALKNRQYPGLNLWIADSPSTLLAHLKTMPPAFHLRCVLKSAVDAPNGWHHLYADIRRETNGPLSILLVEPAHIKENFNGVAILLQLLVKMLPDPYFSHKRISCFNVAVQKSGSDCLIFCIDFALKAHEHASQLNALHAIHHSGHAIGNDTNDPTVEQNNQDTLSIAPGNLLPLCFFEDAQSTTELQIIWDTDPRIAEQIQKIRTQRAISAAEQTYHPSLIEYRRREFLRQALSALTESDRQQ